MAKQDTSNPVMDNASNFLTKVSKGADAVGKVKGPAKDLKPPAGEVAPIGGGGGGQETYSQDIQDRWKNWANTGGFSDDDIANIRARSVSPIRSAFGLANSDIDRQRALQGGYSPNYTASKAKLAREMSSTMSDSSRNVEADIAELRNRGKMAGLEGLTRVSPMEGGGGGGPAAPVAAPKKKQSFLSKLGGGIAKVGKIAGTAATIAGMFSDKNAKENIKPIKKGNVLSKLKELPISEYNYKGDSEPHIGPMAQDFNKVFPNEGGDQVIPFRKLAEIGMAINKEIAERVG